MEAYVTFSDLILFTTMLTGIVSLAYLIFKSKKK